MNLIFFSSGCILILFGKILNSHSQLLSREDNCKCGWCMQHPMSVFITIAPIFSSLLPSSLFITCALWLSQNNKSLLKNCSLIQKMYTVFYQNAIFCLKPFQKTKMGAFSPLSVKDISQSFHNKSTDSDV